MGNIMWGIVFLLAGVVLVWLGIRQRKRAQRDYEDAALHRQHDDDGGASG